MEGLDPASGNQFQEYWRSQGDLHIHIKELKAAQDTVQSLAKPGDRVFLQVENSVTKYVLDKQGGKRVISKL